LGFFSNCRLSLRNESKDVSSPHHLRHRYLARNLDMLEMRMLCVPGACRGSVGYTAGVCGMPAMVLQGAHHGYVGCTPWVHRLSPTQPTLPATIQKPQRDRTPEMKDWQSTLSAV